VPSLLLPDSSAWIKFRSGGDARIASMLEAGLVRSHPSVIGELWLGCGAAPREVARFVADLPPAELPSDEAARALADRHGLVCARIGWVDAQVLLACLASKEPMLTLTFDVAMRSIARRLGVSLD
jgi:predicted nucleic acid-binding protein